MNPIINQAILRDANNLIRVAQMNNAVVTITLQPQEPLAMGNYVMVADVRPARERAVEFCWNCDCALPEGCGGEFKDEPECKGHFSLDAMCEAAMKRLERSISEDVRFHKMTLASSHFERKRGIHERHEGYLREHRGEPPPRVSGVTFLGPNTYAHRCPH